MLTRLRWKSCTRPRLSEVLLGWGWTTRPGAGSSLQPGPLHLASQWLNPAAVQMNTVVPPSRPEKPGVQLHCRVLPPRLLPLQACAPDTTVGPCVLPK